MAARASGRPPRRRNVAHTSPPKRTPSRAPRRPIGRPGSRCRRRASWRTSSLRLQQSDGHLNVPEVNSRMLEHVREAAAPLELATGSPSPQSSRAGTKRSPSVAGSSSCSAASISPSQLAGHCERQGKSRPEPDSSQAGRAAGPPADECPAPTPQCCQTCAWL